jgi:hypothetical protein
VRLSRNDEQAFREMLKDWRGSSAGFTASLSSLAGLMGEIDALRYWARRALDGVQGAEAGLRALLPPPEEPQEPMVRLRVVAPDGSPLDEEVDEVDPLG